MTDVATAPSAAGWYPDPERIGATRFWDGAAWTEHVKGTPARFAPPVAGRGGPRVTPAPGAPYSAALPRLAPRSNRAATAGLTFGILSLIANVLLVPTILGIVFGAIGTARASRRGGVGRVRGIVGIVLAALGVVAALVQLAILIPVFLGLQHGAVVSAVHANITDVAASHGVTIASVECARGASLSHAGHFACLATRTTGARDVVKVTVGPDGRWGWTSPTL
jgi:hypothetical protein